MTGKVTLTQILNGIDLNIEPGESVALVGHSGCGKSTIISLLLRFYDPESGRITLDGTPLNKLNLHWLRNTIGVVSQVKKQTHFFLFFKAVSPCVTQLWCLRTLAGLSILSWFSLNLNLKNHFR
jgi:ABC-type transport system involved in cytochrome bd biosynthesis fused ATPase/permease subunit